jgi:hypothetical protein
MSISRARGLTWLFAAGLCGCLGRPISAGPGKLSSESSNRLKAEQAAARVDSFRRACATADARPADARLQAKAVAMTLELLAERRADLKAETLLQLVGPTLRRLDADVCGGRMQVAAVAQAAGDRAGASTRYLDFARGCGSVDAALAAAPILREQNRCDDLNKVFAELWPKTPNSRWLQVCDEIAACSSPLTLRQNLAFVPPEVRQDYFALREKREREQELRRQEAAREAREQAARDREDALIRACVNDCQNSAWHCGNSCYATDHSCRSECDAIGNLCKSRCHR